jgi:urease
MGDANASIPTVQPVFGRPMWGAQPKAAALNSVVWVSQASIDKGMSYFHKAKPWHPSSDLMSSTGIVASYGLEKRAEAVKKCRTIGKKDMKLNNAMPKMSGMLSFPRQDCGVRDYC